MATSHSYAQYCPVTRALEILGERWTLLIVRDLTLGPRGFNDLARGLPRLSRSLLSKRLRRLQDAGVVEHVDQGYALTTAGWELQPLIAALGDWGARWAFGEPRHEELDPEVLLWWAHDRIDGERFDRPRTVVEFALTQPTFHGWLVVDEAGVSVCKAHPGFEVDATVSATLSDLYEVWLGRRTLGAALRDGTVEIRGRRAVVQVLPEALQLSPAATWVQAARAGAAQVS